VHELWASFFEKAYAKLHGGYDQITSGNVVDCLGDLTGAPREVVDTTDSDSLWDKLSMNIAKGYVIGAIAQQTGDKSKANEIGILSNHTYSIIGVEGEKRVKIKSNFGNINGFDFNDHHKTFIMNMKDLHNNFPEVVICKLHSEYHYSACPHKLIYSGKPTDNNNTTVSWTAMKVEKRSHSIISLNQPDQKRF